MSPQPATSGALWDHVDEQVRLTAARTGCARLAEPLRAALRGIDRAHFVRAQDSAQAYEDRALSIGHGQTISQPFIVALMTQLLRLGPADRVLEIGTGSGYQAAILGRLAAEVVSVERIAVLAHLALARLREVGILNVSVHVGDGHLGWAPGAPYDAILVTAAGERVPDALVRQLARGGRLVAPIGPQGAAQWLCLGELDASGVLQLARVIQVAFVPFVADPP